jgi:dipeptidyl aminopeptidase/acylaminoacyl peptidase
VLMTRSYMPDEHGTRTASTDEGLGVDEVDTRNLQSRRVEWPRRDAWEYISDGRGRVRILALGAHNNRDEASGIVNYLYHRPGDKEWQPLSHYHLLDRSGFLPDAVDSDLNVAYGYEQHDGRRALYSVALDGSLREQLVYANDEVDVDDLIRIGRSNRVVGVTYITQYEHAVYFAPDVKALMESLARALKPATPRVVDASGDESRMLVLTSTDKDPGVYYIFDRKSQQLRTFLVVRSQLEGIKLAAVKPVSYRAADGTAIPGYLTLPPGVDTPRGIPALVMPHGGPSARDAWGFNWLAQFFAARGYAVLQPNFRGSTGYGEQWFQKNGFRSWQVAIGDVLDGGRWLIEQGIADPKKLGIVGWSYGGYAALQSAVVDPTVFRAVVAIAPVTDLNQFKQEARFWTNVEVVKEFVGDGPHVREGSPAEHADRFRVPVLLFHGEMDRNVSVEESRTMEARLKRAGAKCELVTWPDLDHYLQDSNARAQMLNQSDTFLRQAFGL